MQEKAIYEVYIDHWKTLPKKNPEEGAIQGLYKTEYK